jgi:NitT/TauT family transport system permease protein
MSTLVKDIPTTTSPAPSVRRGRGIGSTAALAGPPLAFLALIIAVWYLISALLGRLSFLLPYPHRIFTEGFLDPRVSGDIAGAIVQTLLVSLAGLAVAIVIGVTWAIVMSQARWAERTLYPYAVILQCIPILALVPLIGFWFGQEFFARMIVSVLIALFPMVSNTLFGLQSVDKSQRELFKLQRVSRWTVLTKLQLPTALPAIFAGMRISAGLAVVGAIVGDFFFRRGTPGIGSLISNYTARLQGPQLFAAILAAALLGVAIFALFGWLTKLAVGKWYEPATT